MFKKHPVGNYNRMTLFFFLTEQIKITSSELIFPAINETADAGLGLPILKRKSMLPAGTACHVGVSSLDPCPK